MNISNRRYAYAPNHELNVHTSIILAMNACVDIQTHLRTME